MYYRAIETSARRKAEWNEGHREAALNRMKVVRKKAAGIRRAKKSLA